VLWTGKKKKKRTEVPVLQVDGEGDKEGILGRSYSYPTLDPIEQ
jgi:hypothetical protein